MPLQETFKYFGLYAVSLLGFGLWFVVYKWPDSRHKTFSQHVAKRRQSIVYYFLLFSVVLPLLLLFFIGWFIPFYGLPAWVSSMIVVSSLAQISCTIVPEIGGWKTLAHQALAGISATSLLPVMASIALQSVGAIWTKLLAWAGLLTMLCIAWIIVKNRAQQRKLLVLQSTYFAAFFVPVLCASYLA